MSDAKTQKPALPEGARAPRGAIRKRPDPLRQFFIWVALPAAMVFMGVCALFFLALLLMSSEMNTIDATRSRTAISAAVRTVVDGLDAAVRDEATWTEAYINSYLTPNPAWQDSTWGATARSAGSYDTVMVTDNAGVILFGESSTGPVSGHLSDHVSGDVALMAKLVASLNEKGDDASVAALTKRDDGIAAIAGMVIHGNTGQANIPPSDRRILWISKRVDDQMLRTTAALFLLPLPRLSGTVGADEEAMDLVDAADQRVGQITWAPKRPGDVAFAHTAAPATVVMALIGGLVAATLVAFYTAIKSRAASEERDWYGARYDQVTGLFNRFGLEENLRGLLPRRRLNTPIAVAQIGVDAYSEVVGTYGREAGDELLDALADRIEVVAAGKVSISRNGPSEFTLARPGEDGIALVRSCAVRLLAMAGEALKVGDLKIKTGLSIGVAEGMANRETLGVVIRMAETALARARETGGNHLIEYNPSIEVERRLRLEMQADIRRGLEADEFDLAYQPIIDLSTRSIIGVEALMRWPRRPNGPLSPGEFIPVAESSGLIDELGMLAVERAIVEAGSIPGLKISVNISPVQLRNPNIARTLKGLLDEAGFDPHRLQLELTETFLITQPARAKLIIDEFRAFGIQVALDDFGTGYSSVGYLRQFSFDRVKLDRSLIADIDTNPVQGALVESTMTYAFAMDLAVTAEGVERREEAAVLARYGCREFQGYLFASPLSIEALRSLVNAGGEALSVGFAPGL